MNLVQFVNNNNTPSITINNKPKLFILGVCTRSRPNMLNKCLLSILNVERPANIKFEVVVIDNDHSPTAQHIVEDYAKKAEFKIFYKHEIDTGIPQARNCAVNFALQREADFIGFIDDDEYISLKWLTDIVEAFNQYKCDVIQAPVDLIYETPVPAWISKTRKKQRVTGQRLHTAATDNVAFKTWLVKPIPKGLGLRFDNSMRFSGGSDTDFFYKATDAGATIIWTGNAVATEFVPKSRTTYKWLLFRAYRKEANAAFIYSRRKGLKKALTKYLLKAFLRIFTGSLITLLYLTLLPFSHSYASIRLLKTSEKVAASFGAIAGLMKIQPNVYNIVRDGS